MDDITIHFERLKGHTAAGGRTANGILLKVDSISGHQINLQYETIIGNCPQQYGNKLHIWKGDGVKWGNLPFKTYDIPSDDQDGQVFIDGLNIGKNTFTIGYSVGKEPDQTAACVVISENEGKLEYRYMDCEVKMTAVNDTSVSFSYKTVEGYTPKEHKAWVGIWERKRVPYPAKAPLAAAEIGYDNEEGTGIIGSVDLASGQDYCIGLFLPGAYPLDAETCLAASDTFKY